MTFKLLVWGERACFTRPEMKAERVSYDVITPSAARGVFEAIHWKPAIRWEIDKIHVLKPIRFENIFRNETSEKLNPNYAKRARANGDLSMCKLDVTDTRQQRNTLMLRDVAYVLEANFHMTDRAGPDDSRIKHAEIFRKRASKGRCFQRPFLGNREFVADFKLIDEAPAHELERADQDFGWMLYDFDYSRGQQRPKYFRAEMQNGVIDLVKARSKGIVA